jgi:hypothetical protein
MFVTVDLQTNFSTERIGKFIISLRAKFHMTNSKVHRYIQQIESHLGIQIPRNRHPVKGKRV